MFGRKLPKLACKDVKSTILWLGFTLKSQKGSHQHFSGTFNGKYYKVTLDCPKAPFSDDLIKSMATQAGLSKKLFWKLCADTKKKYSKMPKGYGKNVGSEDLAAEKA